jgi:DNA excision repair protein ERCC-3
LNFASIQNLDLVLGSRQDLVHEFQITIFSLYAAVSIGLEVDDIIDTLSRLSKNDLDPMLLQTMREHGSRIGKLKLVLQDNAYFIESVDRSLLDQLQTAPEIKKARKNRQRVGADGKMALV